MVDVYRHDRARLQEAAAPIVAHFSGALWQPFELRPRENGKFDKIPALGCRTNDPASWFTLEAAIAAIEQYPALAGIGFAIPDGMITLDYDDCRDPKTGQLDSEAQSAVTQCGSYAYATISGRGLRIVGLNNARVPYGPEKYQMVTLAGQKIEVFVGPTNHFNTLAADALPGPQQLADLSGFASNLLGERLDEKGNARTAEDLDDFADLVPLQQVCETLGKLPNPDGEEFGWEFWNRTAAAVHRCTGGSQEGLEAFDAWSAKSFRYCQGETPDQRWERLTQSPMTAIKYGTLVYLVRHTPGGDPSFRVPKRKRRATSEEHALIQFIDAKIEPLQDFVEDLLVCDSLAMLYGPDGAGKTFVMLSLLIHVAWGQPWFGRDVEQGPALLFLREGRNAVQRRIVAFRRQHRLDGQNLPFAVSLGAVDLSEPASVDQVIKVIKAYGETRGAPVKIAAIDTLASALGSNGDENSAEVMNPVLANCHRIRERTGCCLLLVHHPGKDIRRGPRGFSGIRAALDTLIEIEYEETNPVRAMQARKQRDLEIGEAMFYRIKPIEIGPDPRRGKPITSCIIAPILDTSERATAGVKAKLAKLTKQQRMALDALREALVEHGVNTPDGKPAARVTSRRAWRNAFRERFPAATEATTVTKALQRIRQTLLKMQLIGVNGQQVWLAETG